MLIDLDDFKEVNDSYGHLCGDFLLKQVAQASRDLLRPEQVLARVGGDEFVVLAPETTRQGAAVLAEKLCARLTGLGFAHCGTAVAVTGSFGVAELDPSVAGAEELYELADRALYRSKRAGGDRVTVHEPPPAGR